MLEKFGFIYAGSLLFIIAVYAIIEHGNPLYRGPVVFILLLAAAGQFIAQDNRRWVAGIANAIAYFCWLAMVFIALNAF